MSADPSPPKPISRRRFLRGVVGRLVVYGLPTYTLTYGAHALVVTRHRVALRGLPASAHGLRVAHLTDFHRSPWISERYLRAAVARCNALRPDLVALTGDFISVDSTYAASCAAALAGLRAPQGVYAVLGNHDHWDGPAEVTRALESVGVTMLTNRAVRCERGLWVAGVDDLWSGSPDLPAVRRQVPADAPCLLLSHNPRVLPKVAAWPWLALSGHTHGGQIAVPGFDRRIPPDMAGSPYVEGWHTAGQARMYISHGVGMVFPPVRFRCRPELAVFTLETA